MAINLKSRLMAAVLAITMSLQSSSYASFNKNNKNEKQELENSVKSSFNETEIFKLSNRYIVRDHLRKYFDYFDNYDIVYPYEELFLDAEEKELILNSNTQQCDFIFDGDIDKLTQIITKNSVDYLNNHNNYFAALLPDSDHSMWSNDYLVEQIYATNYLQRFLKNLVEDATNDINEDVHKMQDLKVVFSLNGEISDDGVILGQYQSEDNLCILFLDSIKYLSSGCSLDIDELIKSVLYHELNHVRQFACDCRIKKGQKNLTIEYSNDNCNSFIIESSAESALYNSAPNLYLIDANTYDYTYETERTFESLLLFLTIFDNSKQLEGYYNAIFDSNIGDFCDFFAVKSKEDILELYKIIYAFDASYARNSFIDKHYNAEEIKDLTIDDLNREVGFTYNISIFRWVLRDLVKYNLVSQDLTLDENVYLFNLLQFLILDNSYSLEDAGYKWYKKYNRVYDDKFRKEFNELSDMFQKFLIDYYNVDKSELDDILTSLHEYSPTSEDYKYWNMVSKNLDEKFPRMNVITFTNPFINSDVFSEYEPKRSLSK